MAEFTPPAAGILLAHFIVSDDVGPDGYLIEVGQTTESEGVRSPWS
jgi:hypothetical protein